MDLASKQKIKTLLKARGTKPLKRLGQSFLIDRSVLSKIISAADLSKDDIVLEIGPGMGVLTVELAKRAKKVIAVEKDKKMCDALARVLSVQNVQIVYGDILRFQRFEQLQRLEQYKLIANLPYYITSPVIRKFLEAEYRPELMVLMIQKEVAQRICAKPGNMSILSVMVQFYAEPKIISYVSKKSFWPQPKVDSAIIKIVPRPIPEINTKKFFELVKKGFSSRRKMLKNNLGIDIGSNVRAQELSVNDWVNLFHKIYSP